MASSSRLRTLIALNVVALLALAAAVLVTADRESSQALIQYQQQRGRLVADLRSAQQQGYTQDDLAPVSSQLSAVDNRNLPLWLWDRAAFYRKQAETAGQLDTQLRSLLQQVLEAAQGEATSEVQNDQEALARAQQVGVDPNDLTPFQQRLAALARTRGAAHTVVDYRKLTDQARNLAKDLATAIAAQEQENQILQQGADQLKVQTQGDLGALRKTGLDALAQGRNDATVAAYLNRPSTFLGWAAVNAAYHRLERYGGLLGSGDSNQVALGAFAVQRYAGQIRSALMGNLPAKAIVISYTAQQLWAYENGQQVTTTLVTTGRPGLPTDIGPMKVLWKSHPWTMHSPWPRGNPSWYPDTVVQYVLWFTNTGEGLHDAYWQPCCWGPGSQYGPYASHGCIHVPYNEEVFLYQWASVGTPVILIPGDGSPVDNQLAQMTTDDQGNPLAGPGPGGLRGA